MVPAGRRHAAKCSLRRAEQEKWPSRGTRYTAKAGGRTRLGPLPRIVSIGGVIHKISAGNETGVVLSDSGKEIPFVFPFLRLIGAPRLDIRFLTEGMRGRL